jgi:hypothetical protein
MDLVIVWPVATELAVHALLPVASIDLLRWQSAIKPKPLLQLIQAREAIDLQKADTVEREVILARRFVLRR